MSVEQQAEQRKRAIGAAQSVVPMLQHWSGWAEQHGRLHEQALAALVEARVPRLFLPRGLGGDELNPATCAHVVEILADADPAAAWHVMVYNAARLMSARWPTATVEYLWRDQPDTLVAASGHTALTGVKTDQGYVVSGRNSFVSGCHHADYVMSPMLVDDQPHVAILPAAQLRIVDNWDTLGMRGTGSNDVLVEGVEIPALLAVPQAEANELHRYATGRLYRCPSRVVFATYIPVALSLARRALAELADLAQNKVPYASDSRLRERSQAQMHYGRALGQYRAVHGYFYATLEQVWRSAEEGWVASTETRADLYLAGTHTMQACAEVVRHVVDAAGSSVLARGTPLERIMRDMETLKHHGFANESRYASVTQALWGATLDYPLLLR